MFNLLTQPLIRTHHPMTLSGLLAELARDEVESFPALRPHQGPSWHMFLVQLAALALRRSGGNDIFEGEDAWASALRNLTPGFAGDEPWNLVVDDWEMPAFLQPPVPDDVTLSHPVLTADALDLLITSKNHDIKQAVARQGQPEDWLFALVSLQTGEGYGGAGNQGIARMNGGSSSRALLTFAPLPTSAEKAMTPRPGARFRRDVTVLLGSYKSEFNRHDYYSSNGMGLTWLAPWPEDDQLQVKDLDLWFIEVCRRIRLKMVAGVLSGWKGTSNSTRINAKHLKGALGDPFAPVHKTDNKSFTLAGRDFDYGTLVDLLFSGNWEMPLLARPASCDGERETIGLVAEALARGNSKTQGFKSRILPISGKILRLLGSNREQLQELAKSQAATIIVFDKAIGNGLALAAARGDRDKKTKDHHIYAREAQKHFGGAVDGIFFQHLWDLLEAQDNGPDAFEAAKLRWCRTLYDFARTTFETALPTIPCGGMFRPRANARARNAFIGSIRYHYPEIFDQLEREEVGHADDQRTTYHKTVIGKLSAAMRLLDSRALAELRRMVPGEPGCAAFWHLEAECGLIDDPNSIDTWMRIVKIMAILTVKSERTLALPVHNPKPLLGTVLCDGGDPDWNVYARPLLSETRLMRFLGEPNRRADTLERIARMLVANRKSDSGFDCTTIATLLLCPYSETIPQEIVRAYYQRLHPRAHQSKLKEDA